mmetsp:Transcript_29269/g.67386  ORF Transcript_29269/g.67386 Transcript_29269/m.67386 type:complete len:323 (+) Transcript_29269:184-1152(+)
MSATTATPCSASWADRVRSGVSQVDMPDVPATFKPGTKKELSCACSGILLVMLGNYGWIEADGEIDHPEAGRNAGRIFVHASDMSAACRAGARVTFYLYADSQGLGAEVCEVEEAPPVVDAESFPALAQPGPTTKAFRGKRSIDRTEESTMRACATEFVPAEIKRAEVPLDLLAHDLTPPQAAAEELHGAWQPRVNMCEIIDEMFSDGSDDEDEPVISPTLLKLKASVASAAFRSKEQAEDLASTKSTESGEEDSLANEDDSGDEFHPTIARPPGLEGWRPGAPYQGFRPPPGLPEPQEAVPIARGLEVSSLPPWRRAPACC